CNWLSILPNPFLDSSAPAALRQMVVFCDWLSGQRPLNQSQNTRKNEPRSGEKSKRRIRQQNTKGSRPHFLVLLTRNTAVTILGRMYGKISGELAHRFTMSISSRS